VTAPPESFVPEQWQGKRVAAVLGMHAGGEEAGAAALGPLRALRPLFDLWQPMPYTVVQALIDPANPFGRRNYWRAHNLTDLDAQTNLIYRQRASAISSPFTAFIVLNGGGAVGRVAEDATVLGGRRAPFNLHLNCMWEDAAADTDNIRWVKETTDAFSSKILPGMGLNFHTEVGEADVQATFGAQKVERLRRVKASYDPTNLFKLNQNVQPEWPSPGR
jgi:FAD/FMN-containing dehydrogenase